MKPIQSMNQWVRIVLLSSGLLGAAVAKDWQPIPWTKPDDRIPDAIWQTAVAIGRDPHAAVNRGVPLPDGVASPLRDKVKMSVPMRMSYGLTHAMVSTRLVSTTKEWSADTAYVTICRSHHITECESYGPLSTWAPKESSEPDASTPPASATPAASAPGAL